MKLRKWLVSLLFAIIVLIPGTVFADASTEWTPEDFTYGEWTLNATTGSSGSDAVYPGNDYSTYMLPGTKWVVTGFSDSGVEKLKAGNTDLVIPAADPDGRKVQGVGKDAFNANTSGKPLKNNNIKLTSVTLPENVKTTDNIKDINEKWGGAGYLGKHGELTEVGDFFIGNGAFRYNDLTELNIPEGVLYLNVYAFANNTNLAKVTFPSTLAIIQSGAFSNCNISDITFPAETDIRLTIYNQAFFYKNSTIKEITLPRNTLQVGRALFVNTERAVTAHVMGKQPAVNSAPASAKVDITFDVKTPYESVEKSDPTCEEDGHPAGYKCLACGKVFSDADLTQELTTTPALGHNYGDWTKLDEKQHQRVCTRNSSHIEKEDHKWDAGTVTKEATTTAEGVKTYTCSVCKATKTESIPKKEESKTKKEESKTETKQEVKPVTKTDATPASKPVIVAKGIAAGKKKVNISWNKVKNADRYIVYLGRCNHDGKKIKAKKIATVSGKTYKLKVSKLTANKSYKVRVVAQKKINGKYKTIATSVYAHFITGNVSGRYTNPKSLKLAKTSATLKKGKSLTIKGTVTKVKKGKKLTTSHAAKLRFISNNPKVAVVSAKGKVTAKSKGTCTVYVQTINGIWKTVKVTVK